MMIEKLMKFSIQPLIIIKVYFHFTLVNFSRTGMLLTTLTSQRIKPWSIWTNNSIYFSTGGRWPVYLYIIILCPLSRVVRGVQIRPGSADLACSALHCYSQPRLSNSWFLNNLPSPGPVWLTLSSQVKMALTQVPLFRTLNISPDPHVRRATMTSEEFLLI